MDHRPSHYNTVRILAPVLPFYDHATATTHHRHIAAGPGPGPGPGGGGGGGTYGQSILVPTTPFHHHHHHQIYHTRAFSTVNPAKLSKQSNMMIYGHLQQPKVKQQQTEQSGSSLNTWFTWKRKSKNNSSSNGTQRPINVHSHHHHHHHHSQQQQQHQHVSEYCPAANGSQSHVPPSLARLFVQPNGRSATTNCSTCPSSTSSKPMCLCSGLTQSTFMAPTYFDDDDDDATNDKDKQHRATSLESSNHLKYKSKTLKSHKSGKSSFEMNGTIRSISTGSLLLTTNGNKNDCSISTKNQQQQQQKRVTRPFNTLNMNRLNQAKSCDQLHSNSSMEYGSFNTTNRKSILECDINPYELIETERKHKTKDKIKCATIAVKSSRNGYRTKREIDDEDEYEDYLDENEDYEQHHHHRSISTLNRHGHGRSRIHKGIFQAANSIRIAGQSVYSSIKNDTNHLTYSEYDGSGVGGGGGVDKSGKFKSSIDVNQSVNDDRPKMLRCKSSTSLYEWNFDSSTTNTTERTKPKAANFHSILIEPEPDYDMEESEIILDHSKTTDGETNQSIESSKCDTINRRIRSSSITRPKVNPPPPPEPISLPPPTIAPPPPPPPPPPPSDYFTSSENSSPTISLSTLSSSISTLKPIGSINGKSSNLQPSDSISFQNELKEKLNQGVKSILKKTTTNRIVDESSNDSSNDSLESNVDSSSSSTLTTSSSVENRIQAFEQSTTILNGMEPSMIKPKKHVHFRVKTRNGHLSRSRSTSHIITETIHEEDDEHSYYDDVAIPSSAVNSGIIGTRSFDDVSIVSCSSPTLSTMDRRTIHNDQQQNCSVSDTETRASPNSIKNRNDSNQDHGGSSSSSTINVSSSSMDRQSESTYDTKCNNNDDENDDGRRTMSMPNINQRTSLECCHRHHPNAYDQLVCEVANGDVIVHEPNDQPQSSRSMNNMIGRMSNVRSTKHRFDANSSPTPPPIPARRLSTMLSIELQKPIKQESNDQSSQQTKNSFSRAVRTYSTGSVRSLLARKLNRSISGNSSRLSNSQQQQQQQKSNGSKLTLSNLFSMKPIDNERSMANVKNNDQVEEHIYEELDSVYVDAITEQQHHKQLQMSNRSTTLSSFFGGRISRAEILDYLHDAKGRLEKQEINVIDCKKLELDENHDIEDIDDDDDIDDVDQVIDENNHKRSSSSPPLLRPLITNTNDVNDSGNSSFIDSIDYRSTDLSPPYGYEAKSRLRKTRTRNGSPSNIDNTDDVNGNLSSSSSSSSSTTTPTLNSSTTGVVSQSTISSGVNRRNRVSNVSNSSTDSSATSGVSGISSNLSDDVEEDDMNTNSSSSSLGSIGAGADGSAGSASCYYGSLDSSVPIRKGSPTAIVLERNDSGVGPEISSSLTKTKSTNESQTSSRDEYHHYNNRLRCLDCDHESSDNAINDCGSTTNHSGSSSSSSSSSYYYSTFHQPNLCTRCVKKRNERKEIISEIVDTELKYGRDLKIIQDEFARPISVAGLLTTQQVDEIFLNLDELIEVNEHFAEQLRDTLNCAYEQNDMDLTTANIGQLFHDCMLARISVFEQYCIRQGSASLLLNQLEKEKELLRIFLRVSQMENTLLRRMNLRSFLVVPVQRVTKYPLLLNRLHKVTSVHHPDRESLRDAQLKLEFYLESINQKTRGSIAATTSRIWRRISNLSSASIRSKAPSNDAYLDDFGFVRLKKTAIDLLKWPKEECRFVLMGKLSFIVEKSGTSSEQINLTSTYSSSGTIFNQSSSSANNGTGTTNSSSSFWSRTLKFSMANGILVTLSSESLENLTPSEPNSLTLYDDAETINESNRYNSTSRRFNAKCSNRNNATTGTHSNHGNNKNGVREAVLLLFKEKNGRYVLCREILNLAMCVIANATEADSEEFFEIHELESRESLLLKAETHSEMKEWLEQLRHHSSGLGNWRRRRNALPNIMVLRNVIEEQHF